MANKIKTSAKICFGCRFPKPFFIDEFKQLCLLLPLHHYLSPTCLYLTRFLPLYMSVRQPLLLRLPLPPSLSVLTEFSLFLCLSHSLSLSHSKRETEVTENGKLSFLYHKVKTARKCMAKGKRKFLSAWMVNGKRQTLSALSTDVRAHLWENVLQRKTTSFRSLFHLYKHVFAVVVDQFVSFHFLWRSFNVRTC
jgi:hypothetical protein